MKIVDATVLFEDGVSMHGIRKVEIKLLENFSLDPTILFVNLLSPISPAYVAREHVIELLTKSSGESAKKDQMPHAENEVSENRKDWVPSLKSFLVRKLRALFSNAPKSLRLSVTIPLGLTLFIYRGIRRIWHSIASTMEDFLHFVKREMTTSDSVSVTQLSNSGGYVSITPIKESTNLGVLADLRSEDSFFSAGLLWKRLDLSTFARQKRLNGFRFSSIIYDLIPVKFPQFAYVPDLGSFRRYFSFLIQLSDTLMTYSETNIKDVQEYASNNLFLDKTNIERLILGFDDFSDVRNSLHPVDWLSGRKFIIYVSTIERRKNHEVLYRAYKRAVESGFADEVPTLLFVGLVGWGAENVLNDIAKDPTLVDSSGRRLIVPVGSVTQETLNWLYINAHFSVYPSFYEGWGMPVSESIFMGTHVLASDTASLRESGFGLASHIDPNDSRAWLEAIMSYAIKPKVKVSQAPDFPTWREMTLRITSLM